jgi:hypothetical protein
LSFGTVASFVAAFGGATEGVDTAAGVDAGDRLGVDVGGWLGVDVTVTVAAGDAPPPELAPAQPARASEAVVIRIAWHVLFKPSS